MGKLESDLILNTYVELLNQQTFINTELNYEILENHKQILQKIAKIGNSVISVFDIYSQKHCFYSFNFGEHLGYSFTENIPEDNLFANSKIHPVDFEKLMMKGISILKLFYQFSPDEKLNFKLINEYRILNSMNQYVRVIEQHQVLELDNMGNIWLTLSILDISPNQNIDNFEINSQLFNFKTGRVIPFDDVNNDIGLTLTKREVQILKLVKEGLLSKEISLKLSISLHTVNTHRQRFLEKLGANNSMEAIVFASKLGLI